MRGPGIAADIVLARARVAAGLIVHFQENEIAKAALLQPPRGAQPGDAAAYDHHWDANLARGGRNGRVIADAMAGGECVIHKRPCQRAFAFGGHAGQSRRGAGDELATRRRQWLISFQSLS